MKKLGSYLEEVLDWEKFAYQLLPEEKEYLVEVWSLWQSPYCHYRNICISY